MHKKEEVLSKIIKKERKEKKRKKKRNQYTCNKMFNKINENK